MDNSRIRNFGIKKSNGKYLAFLDSDDYWMKDKLSKSVKVLEKGQTLSIMIAFFLAKILKKENYEIKIIEETYQRGFDFQWK